MSTSDYQNLRECPFCGAEPEPINGGEYMFFDHDDVCYFEMLVRGRSMTRSVKMAPDEIAAWNTRANPELDAVPITEKVMARHGWVRERDRDFWRQKSKSQSAIIESLVEKLAEYRDEGMA